MRKSCLLIIIVALTFGPINKVFSQRKGYKIQKNNKNKYEAFPNPFDFRPDGWMFEAGLTATTSLKGSQTLQTNDSIFNFSTGVRPGLALNVGRYHSMKKWHKIVKYIDYNLGYKFLWSSESQILEFQSKDVVYELSNNNFSHYVSLNLNFNNLYSFTDHLFLQNTLGINADYRFVSTTSGVGYNGNVQPSEFIVQLHYKLGLGFMVDNDIAVIPYIEVPVLNITPQQANFSQLDYFNSSYQTFIVGVRVMLFRLGQKDCPKAIGTEGKVRTNGY